MERCPQRSEHGAEHLTVKSCETEIDIHGVMVKGDMRRTEMKKAKLQERSSPPSPSAIRRA